MKFKTIYILLLLIGVISISIYVYNLYNKHPLYYSEHYQQYIKHIHPNMYPIKIKNFDNTDLTKFSQRYLTKLTKPSINDMKILYTYISYIDKLLIDYDISNINTLPWQFLISDNDLEKGMPFTLDKYIVISKKDIIQLNTRFSAYFVEILLHEKIHVLQRLHQDTFNAFYKQLYPFLHTKIPLADIPVSIKKQYMTNPDSNFDFWMYSWQGKIYHPYLKYDLRDKTIKDCLQCKGGVANIVTFKKTINIKYQNISIYHPNEIFAYTVSKHILDKTLPKKIRYFLKSLDI